MVRCMEELINNILIGIGSIIVAAIVGYIITPKEKDDDEHFL